MALIPSLLLKQLYTFGSLENIEGGVQFSIKNRLSDATLTKIEQIKIDGKDVKLSAVTLDLGDGDVRTLDQLSSSPISFPLRRIVTIRTALPHLDKGKHKIEIKFKTEPFGTLNLKVDDTTSEKDETRIHIPRSNTDDYLPEIIQQRQKFIAECPVALNIKPTPGGCFTIFQ